MRRLGVIGGGNMGSAILDGALRAGVLEPSSVLVAEIDAERRVVIEAMGCATSDSPRDAASSPAIMLAVKPQQFGSVAAEIGPLATPTVVISIMAGLSSDRIGAALGPEARVVRTMPNIPARVGAGITAIALGANARPGDEALAVALFDAVGRTVMVDEGALHAVTAVSGSGPAYVFKLTEALAAAARDVGLDRAVADRLARQTVIGAARLLETSEDEPEALRRAVTSPGGTTAAAIETMETEGFDELVRRAVAAARDRGRELDQ